MINKLTSKTDFYILGKCFTVDYAILWLTQSFMLFETYIEICAFIISVAKYIFYGNYLYWYSFITDFSSSAQVSLHMCSTLDIPNESWALLLFFSTDELWKNADSTYNITLVFVWRNIIIFIFMLKKTPNFKL